MKYWWKNNTYHKKHLGIKKREQNFGEDKIQRPTLEEDTMQQTKLGLQTPLGEETEKVPRSVAKNTGIKTIP